MSVQWFIADVLTGVSKALKPLVNALESPVTFGAFLASYGYSSLITDTQQIEAKFSIVKGAYDALEIAVKEVNSLRGQENTSVEITLKAVQKLGTAATNLFHAIDGLKGMTDYASLPAPLNQESFWKDFPPELAESLLYRYLETHKPKLFGLLTAFGIVSAEDADPASLPSFRTPYRRRQVNWDRIELIVSHPDQFLSKVYGLGNTFEHSKFTGNLAILANTFGVPAAQTDLSEELLSAYYGGNPQNTVRQLLAPLYWDAIETGGGYGYTSLDLIVAPIPPAGNPGNTPSGFVFFPVLRGHAGKGIEIVPNVVATLEGAFKSTGSVRLEVRAEDVQAVIPPALGVEIGSRAELVVAPEKALILLGVEGSSRFEIARLAIELSVRGPVGDLEYETSFNVENAALVINLVEGDGFLQKVLPKDGFRTDFDLAVGWSNRKGLYFRGSAGFEATLPVHKSILGILTVESIYLALGTQAIESGAQNPALETVAAATAKVELGPFKASVARMGVRA